VRRTVRHGALGWLAPAWRLVKIGLVARAGESMIDEC
jgi:hypothetical protein